MQNRALLICWKCNKMVTRTSLEQAVIHRTSHRKGEHNGNRQVRIEIYLIEELRKIGELNVL